MKYTLIFSIELMNDLIDKVNESIKEGWKPQGGVSSTSYVFPDIGSTDATLIYTQAMIKE